MREKQPRSLGRPRKEHGAISTKNMILHTATSMFLEKGFPLVSMDDVAEKCNVTKATVYYYFETKNDLFTESMVQLMNFIREKSATILATDEPLKTQLFHIAKAHLRATVDIDIHAFMKEARMTLTEEQMEKMNAAEKELYHELETALSRGINRGDISYRNPRFAALIFINLLTVRNSMDKEMKQSFTSVDDLAMEIVEVYWNGVAGKS